MFITVYSHQTHWGGWSKLVGLSLYGCVSGCRPDIAAPGRAPPALHPPHPTSKMQMFETWTWDVWDMDMRLKRWSDEDGDVHLWTLRASVAGQSWRDGPEAQLISFGRHFQIKIWKNINKNNILITAQPFTLFVFQIKVFCISKSFNTNKSFTALLIQNNILKIPTANMQNTRESHENS